MMYIIKHNTLTTYDDMFFYKPKDTYILSQFVSVQLSMQGWLLQLSRCCISSLGDVHQVTYAVYGLDLCYSWLDMCLYVSVQVVQLMQLDAYAKLHTV